MFSRCSHCHATQELNAEQLRTGRGLLQCSACGLRFDALPALSETRDEELTEPAASDFLPTSVGKTVSAGVWRFACLLSVLVLLVQFFYFEGGTLSRQPQLRAGLLFVCKRLGCQAPAYRNLDEWSVSHSDLRNISETAYVFSAALSNQASFPQVCPDLKLVLLNINGQAVAEGVFSGKQYATAALLGANETARVSLNIVAPAHLGKYGGYTLALL